MDCDLNTCPVDSGVGGCVFDVISEESGCVNMSFSGDIIIKCDIFWMDKKIQMLMID